MSRRRSTTIDKIGWKKLNWLSINGSLRFKHLIISILLKRVSFSGDKKWLCRQRKSWRFGKQGHQLLEIRRMCCWIGKEYPKSWHIVPRKIGYKMAIDYQSHQSQYRRKKSSLASQMCLNNSNKPWKIRKKRHKSRFRENGATKWTNQTMARSLNAWKTIQRPKRMPLGYPSKVNLDPSQIK